MHLRILLFFITFAGGFLLPVTLYALNSKGIIQDTIRKVPIRVVASEKPRNVDFDSLISQAAKSAKEGAQISSKTKSAKISKPAIRHAQVGAKNQEETSSLLVQKQIQAPSERKIIDKQNQEPLPNTTSKEHLHKIDNARVTDNSTNTTVPNEVKTSRTYLWIGFMLIVVGVILGILFGKTALLVSIAGVVFVIIGYSIRH